MTGNTNSKALWIGIPLILAAILAIINSISQGFLWEGPNSRANLTTAGAAETSAVAAQTDADNKLKAAIETAGSMIEAARAQANAITAAAETTAQGQIVAAKEQAKAFLAAAEATSHADNSGYDQLTKPFIGDPAEKLDALNKQIVRLQNEIETGIDSATRQSLSDRERLDRAGKREALEQELDIQKKIATKNWKDAIEMVIGTTGGMLGGIGNLYPSGNEPKPVRSIIQEK